jgi:hypothetical protein
LFCKYTGVLTHGIALVDNTATQAFLAIVKYNRLAGRDCSLQLAELHSDFFCIHFDHLAVLRTLPIAYLGLDLRARGRGLTGNPAELAGFEHIGHHPRMVVLLADV